MDNLKCECENWCNHGIPPILKHHHKENEKLKARIKELETEIQNYAPFKCLATDLEDSAWRNI